MDPDTGEAGLLDDRTDSRRPIARSSSPARLDPGELLAALGELGCARAAQMYAALGFPVIPMHTAQPRGGCSCSDLACPDPGKHPRLRGWKQLAALDPGLVGEWWRRWPDANLALATGRRFDVLDLDGEQGVKAPPPGSAIGSGSCPGWTGAAGVGWSWPRPTGMPAATATPGFGP